MTHVEPLGVELVVSYILEDIDIFQLFRMDSKNLIRLQSRLLNRILDLNNHLLATEDYVRWNALLDKWIGRLENLGHVFSSAQMSVAKRRVNGDENNSSSDRDEIDG